MVFTEHLASQLAALPMRGLCREYPNKLDHVINGPEDLKSPRELHPAFYGCFDWHSSVHGHWMLVCLLKRFPNLPEANVIRDLLNTNLTPENLARESAYFKESNRQSFERPYGWAWLLKLADELRSWNDIDGAAWFSALSGLKEIIIERYESYIPKLTYPVRGGTHANTAFGLTFAWDHAVATNHGRFRKLIEDHSLRYYDKDSDYSFEQEPSGSDFLSPCLIEADLMRRILPPIAFHEWFLRFVPNLTSGCSLLSPAYVSDRGDPQIGHLDGLNLSRAWCMVGIAGALPYEDPYRLLLLKAAATHSEAGLANVSTGDYMGEHWLASFAINLLTVMEPTDSNVARVE